MNYKYTKSQLRNDPLLKKIDEYTNGILPLEIVRIITDYVQKSRENVLKELKEKVKEEEIKLNTINEFPVIFEEEIKKYLDLLKKIQGKENKLMVCSTLFNYLVDYKHVLEKKGSTCLVVKETLIKLHEEANGGGNFRLYYQLLFRQKMKIKNDKPSTRRTLKRRLCGLCKLPGHNRLRCIYQTIEKRVKIRMCV